MPLHLRSEKLLLDQGSIFEQFLDDIVAEYICHHFLCVHQDLFEHLLFVIAICTRDLLLKKPRALLVTSEVGHEAEYVLNSFSTLYSEGTNGVHIPLVAISYWTCRSS